MREDARPREGVPEALEAHTGQQLDVLFIGMIEVDAPAFRVLDEVGVILSLMDGVHRDLELTGHFVVDLAELHALGDGEGLAVLKVGTFGLTAGQRTAPEEIFRHGFEHGETSLEVNRM